MGDIVKTHRTDKSFKCKDPSKFKIHIGGPRPVFRCKVCGKAFIRKKILNEHYKIEHEVINSTDQSELAKFQAQFKALNLQDQHVLSDSKVKSECADLKAQPMDMNSNTVCRDISNFPALFKPANFQAQPRCGDFKAHQVPGPAEAPRLPGPAHGHQL